MDDELAQLAESLRRRELLQERAARLRAAVAEASVRVDQARARLISEQHAVHRLTGFSLASLFAAARGTRDATLLRKQADVRTAQYRGLREKENLAALNDQLDQITAGLAATCDLPAAYTVALTRKEQRLRSSGEDPGPRLDELAALRERLQSELRDLRDTVSLADAAAAALEEAGRALESTAGWSAADIFGGGSIISMIKNDELDEAMDLAAQADQYRSALRHRLTSLPQSATAEQLYIDAFTRLADISLDNTLVDLSVHHQIIAGQDQIDRALRHIDGARVQLTARITTAQTELHQAEAERHALLRP
jgi:hypothetical protein